MTPPPWIQNAAGRVFGHPHVDREEVLARCEVPEDARGRLRAARAVGGALTHPPPKARGNGVLKRFGPKGGSAKGMPR
ncbi:hypothetical protein GCM10022222_15120 [Amycolatopsis ultiminotia]|uniref:Uncharacterized protein n=1 Tax=Amycolatopsis ultiminotia TaxID=543629 RepID=A0ABP6VEX4_9PSEU